MSPGCLALQSFSLLRDAAKRNYYGLNCYIFLYFLSVASLDPRERGQKVNFLRSAEHLRLPSISVLLVHHIDTSYPFFHVQHWTNSSQEMSDITLNFITSNTSARV